MPIQHITQQNTMYVLQYGMGVESTAILLRWILEPDTAPCELSKLLVITAQTGSEWPDTKRDVEGHILPLLRQHGIRFVQVARRGPSQSDKYTVLDDTRQPNTCFTAGDYTLMHELIQSGVVPQYGSEHRCALKFKNFVIETWCKDHFRTHATEQFGASFHEYVAFGFNTDEKSRADRCSQYNTAQRTSFYPLFEWGWDRQTCVDYIVSAIGVRWLKSACTFCPFAHNRQNSQDLLARQLRFPTQIADALILERMALSFNPKAGLYYNTTLHEMVQQSANTGAQEAYTAKLSASDWSPYRVRRILLKKGAMAERAVEKFDAVSDQRLAVDHIKRVNGEYAVIKGISYNFIERRSPNTWPTREDFFVAAPALAESKTRYGLSRFEHKWRLQCEGDRQLELFAAV